MVDLPDTMLHLPDTMIDLPDIMVDLFDTMVDLSDTMVDHPDTMVDLPDTMVDLPDTMSHISSCFFLVHLVFPIHSSLFFKFNSRSLALIALALYIDSFIHMYTKTPEKLEPLLLLGLVAW